MTEGISDEELTDAILLASRAMVAVAVRSLSDTDHEVTLPQYRTLVVLANEGSKRLADLAATLGVSPSTATRMCDRLVRKSLITRTRDAVDRREVNLSVTDDGRRLVKGVVERRRREVQAMLRSIPADARVRLAKSLELLARAAGETPELHWAPGWHANDVVPAAGRRVTTPSAS